MTELLMREAVDLLPSHPETGFVDQSSLLRPVVPLDQENLAGKTPPAVSVVIQLCSEIRLPSSDIDRFSREGGPLRELGQFLALYFGEASHPVRYRKTRGVDRMDLQHQIALLFVNPSFINCRNSSVAKHLLHTGSQSMAKGGMFCCRDGR